MGSFRIYSYLIVRIDTLFHLRRHLKASNQKVPKPIAAD